MESTQQSANPKSQRSRRTTQNAISAPVLCLLPSAVESILAKMSTALILNNLQES